MTRSHHETGGRRGDDRRALAKQNGGCDAPWTVAPAIGAVGLDKRATCPKCGRRVAVTVRGKFANHKQRTKRESGGMSHGQ